MPTSVPAEHDQLELDEVMNRIRRSVQRLLNQAADPSDVSFALAYVATELGLVLAPDPVKVFPMVLAGVADAAAQCAKQQDEEAEELATDSQRPCSVVLH